MLTKDQRHLLEALNRLFERDSTVVDVYALLVATAAAVRGSSLSVALEAPLPRLRELVRSNHLPERKRDLGLDVTDDLRHFIAEQLRSDASENPRQRHVLRSGNTGKSNPAG